MFLIELLLKYLGLIKLGSFFRIFIIKIEVEWIIVFIDEVIRGVIGFWVGRVGFINLIWFYIFCKK